MSELEVTRRGEAADDAAFVERFSALPGEVRREPYRLGLLPAPVWRRLLEQEVPFPTEFWLATRGGREVGRVGANLSPFHEDTAYVGFYEVDLEADAEGEVSRALLGAALEWARVRGAEQAFGPVCFSTWFPYRLRTDSCGERFAWEPENPPAYVERFAAAGFQPDALYHSEAAEIDLMLEGTRRGYERTLELGYRYRPFDRERLLQDEVPLLYAMSMEVFPKSAHLFEPIDLETFTELYVPIVDKLDLDLAFFALDPDGEPAGFLFAFPDRFDGESYLVWKSLVSVPRSRGVGLGSGLLHASAAAAAARGIGRTVSALVRSGLVSERFAKKSNILWRHEYRLFKHTLGA